MRRTAEKTAGTPRPFAAWVSLILSGLLVLSGLLCAEMPWAGLPLARFFGAGQAQAQEKHIQDPVVSKDEFVRQLGGADPLQPETAPAGIGGLRLRGPAGIKAGGEAAQQPPKAKEIAIIINFRYDSTELADDFSRRQLREIAEALVSPALKGMHLEIGGHTDAQGSETYNMDLSLRRAQAVKDALCKNARQDCSRLVVRGYGLSQPVASNDDEAGRAKNRRVVFKRLE